MPKLAPEVKGRRRQELVDAAWRCVARGGYRRLSVDDVCAEAGLSKGAFYTYFDQKQDLLLALLEGDSASLDDIVGGRADDTSAVEEIRRFLAAVVERGNDAAAVQLRADLWAEIAADDALRRRFLDTAKQRRAALADRVQQAVASGEIVDVPPNALAAILVALADGLLLHRSLDPSGFRWTNVRRALDALLEGLRAEAGD